MAGSTKPCEAVAGKYIKAPGGGLRDSEDDKILRQARDRHIGFDVGRYLMPAPMFFTRDRHPLWLGDMYRGRSLFLICGGPSVAKLNLDLLRAPGMTTMSVNNGPATFRTDLWCEVDNPQNFLQSIWMDARIMKFAPVCHVGKKLFDGVRWRESRVTVGDCPNVVYYARNERFDANQWLFEDTLNWGNHSDYCVKCNYHRGGKDNKNRPKVCPTCQCEQWGCRSVMLPAVRIAFILGFRRVFLIGADFKMVEGGKNYHFEQDRSRQSVKNNNNTYKAMQWRFEQLRPKFEEQGFNVYNCNPDSGLTAFDHVPFEAAVNAVREEMPDITQESTRGMYDRTANEKNGNGGKPAPVDSVDIAPKHVEVQAPKTMAEILKLKSV